MGTWDAGPFSNDEALDFVGDVVGMLMIPIQEFLDSPEIDDTFDPAFAAIALLNTVMSVTPVRPAEDDAVLDGSAIRDAMIGCFDEQIDGLEPDPDFKRDQRAALVSTLDEFMKQLAAA